MSYRDSELYLLNVVKNPQVLYAVYQSIKINRHKTVKDLVDSTCLSESLVNDSINIMKGLSLIEKQHDVYYVNNDVLDISCTEELHFKLIVINRLVKISRNNNMWDKQAVFYLIYKYLIINESELLNIDNDLFVNRIDNWFTEINYIPKTPTEKRINMNREKINNWLKYAKYVGLVYELKPNMFVKKIDEDVFFNIMKLFYDKNKSSISIKAFLHWLNENYMPADKDVFKSEYKIPDPYDEVIKNLHVKKLIYLDVVGDYPQYEFENDYAGHETPKKFNVYKVMENE